jgi:hypothetical protein
MLTTTRTDDVGGRRELMSQLRCTGSWTNEVIDDVTPPTPHMHGEREVKTENNDHNSLIGGALQIGLAEVINQELYKALGTGRPHRLCQIYPTAGYGAHVCKRNLYLYFC